VAARVGEPDVARRLRAVLHGAESVNPFGDGAPPEHLGELSHLLHVELAELAGNPVLALFLRILITLWARQGEANGAEPPDSSPEASGAVARAHQGIVDALLIGDGGLARHRMRRHLSVLTEWWQ
jgi:DNA-binding FadR family transcriptional regulator